jgi:predicted dehydrogenase
METVYNWGIIGLGKIAHRFTADLLRLPNVRVHAVASTSMDRGRKFAEQFGAKHVFDNYEDLVACPGLDIVYVATPHVLHYSCVMACLARRIPVLCEKPLSMNAGESERLISMARDQGVFLMEAIWTRFIPSFEAMLSLVASGRIGRVHTVKSDFGFRLPYEPQSRLFNKSLGGGTLLDIGIYPVFLALSVLGIPDRVQAMATYADSGVDDSCIFQFQYSNNGLAMGHCTVLADTPVEASILGSAGSIHLPTRWHHASSITLRMVDEEPWVMEYPFEGWGLWLEAAHVMECLEAGFTESPKLPLDFSLSVTKTLDQILDSVGIRY